MNILAALDDRNLLGDSIRDPDSWRPWRALLAAAFGLPLEIPTRSSYFAIARAALWRQPRPQATFGSLSVVAAAKVLQWP